jgi:adenylate cyclase
MIVLRGYVCQTQDLSLAVTLAKLLRRRPPLVVVLGSAFALFVLVSVGSVLTINYTGAQQSTRELIQDKARLMLATLEQRLRQHLEPVASQAQFLSSLIDRGLLNPDDPAAINTALRSALSATPQVMDVAFIRADLSGVRVSRQDSLASEVNWASRPDIVAEIKTAQSNTPAQWQTPRWSLYGAV